MGVIIAILGIIGYLILEALWSIIKSCASEIYTEISNKIN